MAESIVTAAPAPVIPDALLMGILVVLAMIVIYLIIREIRIMKTSNRAIELDLEKDKLKLLQQHEAQKNFPFTRFTPEQMAGIRAVEDENLTLGTAILAKEKLLEQRIAHLENLVKDRKLDNLLAGAQEQEKKVK